jgi:glycosyltransferase involved in cell wall biosynthesis
MTISPAWLQVISVAEKNIIMSNYSMPKKILFLVPYPLHESPSQRFRFEQYFNLLDSHGFGYSVQSFLNSHNWQVFFKEGKVLTKLMAIVVGLVKRIIILPKSLMYDFVFIHREVAPIGPPVFEWILAKVLKRKIIYDFDDAIWITDRRNESWILRIGKWRSKVGLICNWSYKVSCGNEYLCSYARLFSPNVVYNPTTIDTKNMHNPSIFEPEPSQQRTIRIGWTGSHSTLKYLIEIEKVLNEILRKYPHVKFVVIADRKPTFLSLPLSFISWNPDTEIKDLMTFDIGIMPLPDDQWANGKCGFKALQYMALELPAVASPVGVNSKIIDHGINGFLCSSPQAWEDALQLLIENSKLRKSMGENGRKKIIRHYSVLSNSASFLSIFE